MFSGRNRLLVVYGLKRSGHHAVINWLVGHSERAFFFNDIVRIGPILEGKEESPVPKDFWSWIGREMRYRSRRGNDASWRERVLGSKRMWKYPVSIRQRILGASSVIASLEDQDLQFRPFCNTPADIKNVFVLRDPYNWLSSRIRMALHPDRPYRPSFFPREAGPAMNRAVELWRSYAREFLGTTQTLENKVCVYFDSWFASQEYRKRLSSQLGFDFSDRGYSRVSSYGGGSSFDGTQYDGDNTRMDVLSRHAHLSDAERRVFDQVMSENDDVHDLATQVKRKIENELSGTKM